MVNLLITALQKIIDLVGGALNALISILPLSPFTYITEAPAGVQSLLSGINYFIPIYNFIAILQAWLIAIAIYYFYSIYARWLKAIQ